MSDKLTTAQAIERVLGATRKPMRVRAIIAAAVPLTALAGKTPGQVVYSTLYGEKRRPEPRWVQVGRGEFKAAPKSRARRTAKAGA